MINSRTFSKKSSITLLVCACICSGWALFAKSNFLDTLKGTQAKEFSYINYEESSGNAMWHLSGENPTFLDDSKISIQKPKLLFFGQKGDANIRADKAIVSGNAKHCEMIGAVEAKYQNSQHVKTQHALIDMSSQTVTFPGPFQAQIEKSELKANKGRLDLKPYQIITYGPSELDYIP